MSNAEVMIEHISKYKKEIKFCSRMRFYKQVVFTERFQV